MTEDEELAAGSAGRATLSASEGCACRNVCHALSSISLGVSGLALKACCFALWANMAGGTCIPRSLVTGDACVPRGKVAGGASLCKSPEAPWTWGNLGPWDGRGGPEARDDGNGLRERSSWRGLRERSVSTRRGIRARVKAKARVRGLVSEMFYSTCRLGRERGRD